MREYIFIDEEVDNLWLPQNFWEQKWEPPRTLSTDVTEFALTIAQDVEYVEVKNQDKGNNDTDK